MDGDTGGQTARAALRNATGPVHERLHRAQAFAALARGELMLGDYALLLGKLGAYYFAARAHVPIEPARLALLRDDLEAVGAPPHDPLRLAGPPSEAARLGWRYVVDGSIFGGRVIHRQLDYLFGAAERGRGFFRGSPGAAAGWQRLCVQLEDTGADPQARDDMIAGANEAFASFERLIDPPESANARA